MPHVDSLSLIGCHLVPVFQFLSTNKHEGSEHNSPNRLIWKQHILQFYSCEGNVLSRMCLSVCLFMGGEMPTIQGPGSSPPPCTGPGPLFGALAPSLFRAWTLASPPVHAQTCSSWTSLYRLPPNPDLGKRWQQWTLSVKVHLDWTKANAKAIVFFDLCHFSIWTINWIIYEPLWNRCRFRFHFRAKRNEYLH